MGKPKARKPLPQFKSLKESQEFYAKYGEMKYWGRIGEVCEACLYSLNVIDGRTMRLLLYDDGKVEELVF